MFKGSMVALVTPMKPDGTIDKKSLAALIEWHIAERTEAIIVAGSTGEAATLSPEEQLELISFAVKVAAGRLPIIAGTGTNSTEKALKLTQNAEAAGANACLIVTPYYNKPPQNGLYEHYKLIANEVSVPIILYNVPGRTACDLLPETVERLSQIKNIIGIKEATGDRARAQDIRKRCGKEFTIYSGDDLTGLALILDGADGVISVTANIAPRKMYEMCKAALAGDQTLAEKINAELMLLHERLFVESNPIPAKWVLQHIGKIEAGIRLPLLPLNQKYYALLKEALHTAGVN